MIKIKISHTIILGLVALIVLSGAAWYFGAVRLLGVDTQEQVPQQAKEIVLYNWEGYTDLSVLEDFEKEYGIKVRLEEYALEVEMLSTFQSSPSKYDVVITGAHYITTLIESRLLAELDLNKIPNLKFIKEDFRGLPHDPLNKYSVPYLWGTTGLIINTDFISEVADSWDILWDEKNKGKIALIDNPRDSILAVLKYSNFSINEKNPEKLKIVEQNALLLKENGVQFIDSLEDVERVVEGDIWVAQVYSGDVLSQARGRKNIIYLLPREGGGRWIDNYVIGAGSTNKEAAHALINFLLRPDMSARIANTFSYATPNKDAETLIDPDVLANPIIYPSEEQLKNSEYILDVGVAQSEYNRIYSLMK